VSRGKERILWPLVRQAAWFSPPPEKAGKNPDMRRLTVPKRIRAFLRDPERAENLVLASSAVTVVACLLGSIAAMLWLK